MTCMGFALGFAYLTCTAPATPPASTYCQIAKPIYWAAGDTRKSKEAMDTHNRVWKRLCRK